MSTPWARGRLDAFGRRPTLLFGQMYEDADIELSVFPNTGRVFAIASAGSTSMALSARGLEVTAVDINPAQVDYVRQRLAGGPVRSGTADRLFAFGRSVFPLLGLWPAKIRAFLEMDDPPAQLVFWRRHLDTVRFRLLLRVAINRFALQAVYHRTFLTVVPPRFDRAIRARLERCFGRHPNRTNPYAWRLLAGCDPPDARPVAAVPDRIQVVLADAVTYLENCPPYTFNGFTLSNILDGTDEAYRERLLRAVRRSGRKAAPIVLRSFAEPQPDEPTQWIQKDRSLLWGVVRVETVS